jgi:hypothetical protein
MVKEEEMCTSFRSSGVVADPEEINMLTRVYDAVCRDHSVRSGTTEADDLARAALSLFEAGLTDETEIFESLNEFLSRKTRR